jgi:hypothetical protein
MARRLESIAKWEVDCTSLDISTGSVDSLFTMVNGVRSIVDISWPLANMMMVVVVAATMETLAAVTVVAAAMVVVVEIVVTVAHPILMVIVMMMIVIVVMMMVLTINFLRSSLMIMAMILMVVVMVPCPKRRRARPWIDKTKNQVHGTMHTYNRSPLKECKTLPPDI